MPDHPKWELDPEADLQSRDNRKRIERNPFRFFEYAPPKMPPVSPIAGGGGGKVDPPFCPMMIGHIGVPIQQASRVIGGQNAVEIQVQIQQAVSACLRGTCLFWDRHEERCGLTSLLVYLARVEAEDADAEGVDTDEENPAEAPGVIAEAEKNPETGGQ